MQKFIINKPKISKYILILFFIAYSTLIVLPQSNPVYAEEQIINVSPVIINVPLSPGKTYTHEIKIKNLTSSPLPIRLDLTDFQSTGEEGGYIFTQESIQSSILSWISLSDHEMLLSENENKSIKLSINTPSKIALGGYHGMIFITPLNQASENEKTQIATRIGILIIGNIGVPEYKNNALQIKTFEHKLFLTNPELPLTLRIKNSSLHYLTTKPILRVKAIIPTGSETISPHFLEEKIIFQGKIRKWQKNIPLTNLLPNIYKLDLSVSGGNNVQSTTTSYMVYLPLHFSLITFFTILLLILLLLHSHKNKYNQK